MPIIKQWEMKAILEETADYQLKGLPFEASLRFTCEDLGYDFSQVLAMLVHGPAPQTQS